MCLEYFAICSGSVYSAFQYVSVFRNVFIVFRNTRMFRAVFTVRSNMYSVFRSVFRHYYPTFQSAVQCVRIRGNCQPRDSVYPGTVFYNLSVH
jgi:hypothetical protein